MAIDLTKKQTSLLTAAIANLGSGAFAQQLLDFIRSIVSFDSAVMLSYPDDAGLNVIHDELDAGDRAPFDGPYRNGLYLLSPLYIVSHAGRRG
jgi:hypothetical protein